ncbi:MAG: hypothetical protein KJP23_10490 [Deltaproteobacteria bacterium]|nr:hypothetical protein [Deltaproteobacteria bacterium]
MWYFRIASIIVLLWCGISQAENLNVIFYTPAVDLVNSSDADKEIFLAGLLPNNVVNSQAYQNATLQQKITYARDEGYITPYMIRKGLVPLIQSVLTDKYDVLRNYILLKQQGNRYVFHTLLEKNRNLPNVKAWIDAYNEGKSDIDKIWYWYGNSVDSAYQNLWTDENAFAHIVATKILRYPAFYHLVPGGVLNSAAFKAATLGEQYQYGIDQGYFDDTQERLGTVEEAEANGVSINGALLRKYGVPLRPFEG